MGVELHLPDLPEVPISLGPLHASEPRVLAPWHLRLREGLSSYLPLLLMTLLALATWWLVKNSPGAPGTTENRLMRTEPDYSMTQFALERFASDGALKLRVEGAQMQHFPATDRIEIEDVQIRAIAPNGRLTLAHAKRAISNGEGSEIQLMGGAEVTSQDEAGAPLVLRGEFLHAFLVTERVRTHLPVWIQRGSTDMRAGGLEYDHATGRLDLKGPVRAVIPPGAGRR
jgi:lipopolysaccharide export system protein LptC